MMDIELFEIRDFLSAIHPFDALPQDVLDRLPKTLSIRYLRRGTRVPPPDADARYLYIIRQGAVETRDSQGDLVAKIGEGEVFPSLCDGDEDGIGLTSVTSEDTLVYLLECAQFDRLRRDHDGFANFFNASTTQRLRNAIEVLQRSPQSGSGLLTMAVGDMLARSAVIAGPSTTIQEAAHLMSRERVSSLLVMDGETFAGIVTDRDMRSRCLAKGVSPMRPISEIMTTDVHTVSASAPGFEALMRMTQLNVHHLPVVNAHGAIGMVSATDLIRQESASAVYLASDVGKADSVEALTKLCSKLPELQVQLSLAGANARNVGEAVSSVNDAVTRRLIQLAAQRFGEAPVPYAWVCAGSHARREQTSHSDQDNALIVSDEGTAEDDLYFESLARFVNDGLNACGFVYCPGEVMACNATWRQPRRSWRRYFDTWIEEPDPKALMHSSVFFDLRVVHGEARLLENLKKSASNRIFLAHMVGNALKHRPPIGFFRNIVLVSGGDHDKTFDIKHRGIVPVVDLARVYALGQGSAEVNTVQRLQAMTATEMLSAEGARDLVEAYDFIATLRVRHQARQLRSGQSADNFVAPGDLSTLERNHLKDAFGVITTMQKVLEQRYFAGTLV